MPKYIVSHPAITLYIESRSSRSPINLRTHVAQCLRAFIFISHHRTHRFALLQQLFGDRAPYPTDASRRAGDQNWICHVWFPPKRVSPLHGQVNHVHLFEELAEIICEPFADGAAGVGYLGTVLS
jgi:hypothetical protein